MKFIYGLRDRPRTKGDYTDKDASLQIRQIKIIGAFAISYWLDDADIKRNGSGCASG